MRYTSRSDLFRKSADSEHTMHRISLKGVVIGNITDIVATFVVTAPLVIYLTIKLGLPPEKVLKGVIYAVSPVLGGICSVLGGYVSARIAKHDELLNGALSSILCVSSGLYALISGGGADLWMHLAFLPLSPTLGALGGHFWSRQAARTA